MKRFVWLALMMTSYPVEPAALAQEKSAPVRTGQVQGIEVRVLGLRTASEFRLFPGANSPVIAPPSGMALAVVRFSVTPKEGAKPLNGKQFAVKDPSGKKHECAFTSLYNNCEGKKDQTCEFPFNVPPDARITALVVGDLELSLEGLSK